MEKPHFEKIAEEFMLRHDLDMDAYDADTVRKELAVLLRSVYNDGQRSQTPSLPLVQRSTR